MCVPLLVRLCSLLLGMGEFLCTSRSIDRDMYANNVTCIIL